MPEQSQGRGHAMQVPYVPCGDRAMTGIIQRLQHLQHLQHVPHLPLLLTTWLAAVNLLAFVSFGLDKAQARMGVRRTRESTLLGLALVGGTAGAYAGRAWFRHKTRKESFSTLLLLICALQLGALIGLALTFR